VEHPIPESLGNDDLILDRGFVCDSCNQYFGSKLESKILAAPPFNVERTGQAIPTKKGRLPRYEGDGFSLISTGCWDTVFVVAPNTTDVDRARQVLSREVLWVTTPQGYADLLARFLLKIGLELLVISDGIDPYGEAFDPARACARFGSDAGRWDVGYGRYPHRNRLKISSRVDEFGRLETRRIYQYEMGVMASGDVVLSFTFVNHIFVCNLSRPHLTEYLLGFNAINEFSLKNRWHLR
jgi:hypothetical protein